MTKYFLFALLMSCLVFNSNAQEDASNNNDTETLYVTDQLRLSLYERADSKSKVIQYLTSGDELKASEISGPYAFVTTVDQKKGWVKRGFLVSKLPTVLLLKQEEEKTLALADELKKLANSSQIIDQYEKDMDGLTQRLEEMTVSRDQALAEIDEINQQEQEKQRQSELEKEAKEHKASPLEALITIMLGYWQYLIPIFLGFILLGFLIAKQWLENRIKKKFQGIKVW